jgi:hypothetical protein
MEISCEPIRVREGGVFSFRVDLSLTFHSLGDVRPSATLRLYAISLLRLQLCNTHSLCVVASRPLRLTVAFNKNFPLVRTL